MAVLGRLQPFVAVTQLIAFAMPAKGNLRPETVISRGLTECPLVDQKADNRADCCGARYLSVGYAGFGISKRKKLAGSDFVAL